MTIKEIAALVKGQITVDNSSIEQEINHAYASNKENDILKVKGYEVLLITDRKDTAIIDIAQKAALSHVLIVKCEALTQEQILAAKTNNITLLSCELSMFMAVASLSDAGMLPVYPQ